MSMILTILISLIGLAYLLSTLIFLFLWYKIIYKLKDTGNVNNGELFLGPILAFVPFLNSYFAFLFSKDIFEEWANRKYVKRKKK